MTEPMMEPPAINPAPLERRTQIPLFDKIRSFGRGIGIEVLTNSLRVTLTQVRPNGIRVLDAIEIERYRERPAAEWGVEYAAFLTKHQLKQLPVTVVLPATAVVSRTLAMTGVGDKELDAAVRYQLDDLHPFPEEEARFAYARLRGANQETLLIGIGREAVIHDYATIFEEAGVDLAQFVTPAVCIYSALRVLQQPPLDQFLALVEVEDGLLLYGETGTHPAYCVRVDSGADRAVAAASAQIRLPDEAMVHRLAALLPFTERQEVASPLSYAASLVNALQGLALPFNLLPVERRKVISPWLWVPSIVLVVALAGLGLALAYYQDYENKRLLELLDKEAAALQPVLLRKKALDREMGLTQKRIDYLVQLGASPQQDLETLKELTRILPQNAWLARLELTRKTATLAGETDQATELLRVLDASPYFQGSEFLGTPGRSANGKEAFQIRTQRREIPRVAPAPTPTPSVGGPNVTPQRPVMPVPGMAPTMPITGPPPGMAPGMPNNPGGPR